MRRSLALLTVLSLPAVADVLADPTRPADEWRERAATTASAAATPRLTSILVSRARRVAVIDGVALAEGQSANGITVVRIDKSGVDATVRGSPLRLTLGDARVTKEPR